LEAVMFLAAKIEVASWREKNAHRLSKQETEQDSGGGRSRIARQRANEGVGGKKGQRGAKEQKEIAAMDSHVQEWVDRTDEKLRVWGAQLQEYYRADQVRNEMLITRLCGQIRSLHIQLTEMEDEICRLREERLLGSPVAPDDHLKRY
jgi:hypothetical protein